MIRYIMNLCIICGTWNDIYENLIGYGHSRAQTIHWVDSNIILKD